VVVIPAFHGELLGDPAALHAVRRFLTDQPVSGVPALRTTAEIMAAAATAWRMPVSAAPSAPCGSASGMPGGGQHRPSQHRPSQHPPLSTTPVGAEPVGAEPGRPGLPGGPPPGGLQ